MLTLVLLAVAVVAVVGLVRAVGRSRELEDRLAARRARLRGSQPPASDPASPYRPPQADLADTPEVTLDRHRTRSVELSAPHTAPRRPTPPAALPGSSGIRLPDATPLGSPYGSTVPILDPPPPARVLDGDSDHKQTLSTDDLGRPPELPPGIVLPED